MEVEKEHLTIFYAIVSTSKNISLNVKKLCVRDFRVICRPLVVMGETYLINAVCKIFRVDAFLLCSNHAIQSIKKKLKDLVGDIELRKTVHKSIFENEF